MSVKPLWHLALFLQGFLIQALWHTKAVIEITILNNLWMSFFVISRIAKVEAGVIRRSRRLRFITLTEEKCFCFFKDNKLSKAPELDMITRRNHAPRSYMADYPWPWVSLSWFLFNLQLFDVLVNDFENSMYALGQSEKT